MPILSDKEMKKEHEKVLDAIIAMITTDFSPP
jgi:hypothetical protein